MAIDHYVNFRGISVPESVRCRIDDGSWVPDDTGDWIMEDYVAPCAWGYVGKLTDDEAKSVQSRLSFEFECMLERETQKIGIPIPAGSEYGLRLSLVFPPERRPFFMLLSLPVLTDFLLLIVEPSNTDPEYVESRFKLFLDGQKLTLAQQTILAILVETTNSIRRMSGGEDRNIENKYMAGVVPVTPTGQFFSVTPEMAPNKGVAIEQLIKMSIGEVLHEFIKIFREDLQRPRPVYPVKNPNKSKPPTRGDRDDGEEDIVDTLARLKGRWVSQKDFLDENINANHCKEILENSRLSRKNLQHWRKDDDVVWSLKDPKIGRDRAGLFLEEAW
jgi:hypothetical protein